MSLKQILSDWPDAPIVMCKGCGKKIIFGRLQDGKQVPLDPSPPVYMLMRFRDDKEQWVYRADKAGTVFVSHFATCPKANDF